MNRRDKHFITVKDRLVLSSMHNIHLYSKFYKNIILTSKLRDIVKLDLVQQVKEYLIHHYLQNQKYRIIN